MKFLKKTFEHYKGTVHDLTVENSHTYNVEGLAVHNSAAGALLSYVLGITQVHPLKWGLMFSRFMRKDQTDFPDIDFDVSRNDELKEILIEKWGKNKVVPISNWNTLQLRSLIKDISKFYGIDFKEVNECTSVMEQEAKGPAKAERGMKAGVINLTWEDVKKHSPTLQRFLEKYPFIEEHIHKLLRQVKSCFSNRCLVLTNNGWKLPTDLCIDDSIAFIDQNECLSFNEKFSLIFQGEKELFLVETEDGQSIELTADHEVQTQNGWKRVQDLTLDDALVVI